MSATAFQRRRREIARLKAEQEAKLAEKVEAVTEDENEGGNIVKEDNVDNQVKNETAADTLDIDSMEKEELLERLKGLGINKPVNTGLPKLKEALRDAING
jgi:IMP dehydrogenase/GMP reductase